VEGTGIRFSLFDKTYFDGLFIMFVFVLNSGILFGVENVEMGHDCLVADPESRHGS